MTSNQIYGSEDCQWIRTQTRERAQTFQEIAVRTLARQNPEEALRLNLALMQQECLRMQNCIGQEDNEQVGEALRQYERLTAMNREIQACAEQLGCGPQAQQMIAEATVSQSGVLSQIRNQLQTNYADYTKTPLQTQTRKQEQYRLEAGNTDEPAPTSTQEQSGNGNGYTGEGGADSGSGQKP